MGKVKDVEVVKLLLQDKKYQSPMGKVKTRISCRMCPNQVQDIDESPDNPQYSR